MTKIIESETYVDYSETKTLFESATNSISNKNSSGCFYILEHKPVFTLGKHGGKENIVVPNNIPVYETERGGNVTYHGPGQIVIYPIISIKNLKIGVKDYIFRLEEIVIKTLERFGVKADRNSLNHGVWVGSSKIASVGVKISRGITQHGIALNINTDLTPFTMINPCGLKDIQATSTKEILNITLNIKEVKKIIIKNIKIEFPECFNE